MRKAVLLYNLLSGRRHKRRIRDVEAAAAILKSAGVQVEIAPTRAPSDSALQVSDAVNQGCDTVVACGGDGTIHDIVQGLAGNSAALGVIPLGTANALAHDLELPMNPAEAARALLTAVPRKVSLGKIEYQDFSGNLASRYFVIAAGVGMDAHLFYKLNRVLKGRVGMTAYYSKAIHLWLSHRMRYFEAKYSLHDIEFDEPRLSELLAVRITHFGGLLKELAPGASLARNDLRLVLCRTGNRVLYLAYVLRGIFGLRRTVPGIALAFATRVVCRGMQSENLYVEADGELLGRLPATFSMAPAALNLLVPTGLSSRFDG